MQLVENTTIEFSDITAWDKNYQKLLVSKVRARSLAEDLRSKVEDILKFEFKHHEVIVPFGMTVTPEKIDLYGWDGNILELLFTFSTPEVLIVYDSDFEKKRIFESYLETLVESWLRDLAYHWKSTIPPKYDELHKIGFIQNLADADQQDSEP